MGPAQRRRSPGVEVEKGRAPGVPEEIPPATVPLAIDPGARFAGSLGRERETPRGWRNPAGQGEHDRRTNRPDWPCNTGSDLCRVPAPAAVGRILHVYSSASGDGAGFGGIRVQGADGGEPARGGSVAGSAAWGNTLERVKLNE